MHYTGGQGIGALYRRPGYWCVIQEARVVVRNTGGQGSCALYRRPG